MLAGYYLAVRRHRLKLFPLPYTLFSLVLVRLVHGPTERRQEEWDKR
jgi:hypothetical protein